MKESSEVLDFVSDMDLSLASVRLGELQEKAHDFAALEELYQNALLSLRLCHDPDQADFVLGSMTALEDLLHLQGHWQEASEHVGYALDAAQHLQDGKALAHWQFYAGLMQDELGHYERAERDYQISLKLAQAANEIGVEAETMRRLGWLAHVRGEVHAAEARYREAVEMHRRLGDKLGEARDQRQLGILAMQSGEFDQARQHFQFSLDLVEGRTDEDARRVQAGVQLDLGRMALRQDRLQEAQQHLEGALVHAQPVQDRLLSGDIYFHQAVLAEKLGDWQEAQRQYGARLDLARQAGDTRGQASSFIALGTLALRQSDLRQAQDCYKEAIKFGDRHDKAVAAAQLGTLAYLQKDYSQAETYLHHALDAFHELNRPQEMAGCHQQLGLVAQTMGQWQEAQKHYLASLELRQKTGLLSEAVQSYYQLGTLAQQLGQRDEAQNYYKQALDIGERVGFPNVSMIRQALTNLLSPDGSLSAIPEGVLRWR